MSDIQDALQKVKQGQEGQKTRCEKCKKNREASRFCRDCGKFICQVCIEIHETWEDFATHEVISLEKLMSDAVQMLPPIKKTLYCSKHQGKELDLFCETDHELICQVCVVTTHQNHHYNLASEAIPKHRDAIAVHVGPVMLLLSSVSKAIHDLDTTQDKITDQRARVEVDIHKIRQLHDALDDRAIELIDQLDQMTQRKITSLSVQKDELELLRTQLHCCVEFVNSCLKTGSEREILTVEKQIEKRVTTLCTGFKSELVSPRELADMILIVNAETLPECTSHGQISSSQVCPEKCYATGKGLDVTTVGELNTVTVHAMNKEDKECSVPLPYTMFSCELVSCSSGERMKCEVMLFETNKYEIQHQFTHKGRYDLHIKVSDQHIKGSPFIMQVLRKFNVPSRYITRLNSPVGVAIDEGGLIIIAERDSHCISIHTPAGERVKLFGLKGSAPGQLKRPCGVAVDKVGNILVVDADNHRIQKFTMNGTFLASVEIQGIKSYSKKDPPSISVSPSNKVYICDNAKSEVQILNPDFSLHTTFGCEQLSLPWDMAFDSRGNVYIADSGQNNGIRVFSEDGNYIGQFGKKGASNKLTLPAGITIDSDDVVYVTEKSQVSLFTIEGRFLKSVGESVHFDRPSGISVDKDGLVYVCDTGNNRVHVW